MMLWAQCLPGVQPILLRSLDDHLCPLCHKGGIAATPCLQATEAGAEGCCSAVVQGAEPFSHTKVILLQPTAQQAPRHCKAAQSSMPMSPLLPGRPGNKLVGHCWQNTCTCESPTPAAHHNGASHELLI